MHKAPANEVVRGAVDLELQITKGEQDLLNPIGVNCIRAFPGRGIRVWGARTLSSDPAWRYLNVRRLLQLPGGVDPPRHPVGGVRAERPRRCGPASGATSPRSWSTSGAAARCSARTPEEAFYVKCDAETNPPESVDLGRVICEIGIAPVKPAEFVIFRLAQFSGGSGELEE